MTAARSTVQCEIDVLTAGSVVRLLVMFAEFPSTPHEIAVESQAAAREISLRIPFPTGSVGDVASHHAHNNSTALLDRSTAVASAGLLEALAGMPSTPPDLRDDADATAQTLWRLVDDTA